MQVIASKCELHYDPETTSLYVVGANGIVFLQVANTDICREAITDKTLIVEWANRQCYVCAQKYLPSNVRACFDQFSGRLTCYPFSVEALHKVAALHNIAKVWARGNYYRVPITRQNEFIDKSASGEVDAVTVNRFNKIITGKV